MPKLIKLPHAEAVTSEPFTSVLQRRETCREYSSEPVTLEQLGLLLHAAQGLRGSGAKLVSPSAQEQYPLKVYLVANRVDDIQPGLYRYHGMNHGLETLSLNGLGELFENAAIGEQPWVSQAAMIIVLTADIEKMNHHFASQPPLNQRGERYAYIETGAVAQNVHLQATSLDLGMVLVGGYDNEAVKHLLNQPEELEPVALICIGNRQ